VDRLPKVLRLMKVGSPRAAAEIDKMSSSQTMTISGGREEIRQRLPGLFSYREESRGEELNLAGQRSGVGHFGPILSHLGLLALVVGGILSSVGGYKTEVSGLPGDVVKDPAFDFSVRIDSFSIVYYPLGIGQWVLVDGSGMGKIVDKDKSGQFKVELSPEEGSTVTQTMEASRLHNQFDIQSDRGNIKSYITVLTVLDQDREALHQRIEVNHPLRYKGFRFYQASFDPEHPQVKCSIDSAFVIIKNAAGDQVVDSVYLRTDQPYRLPDGNDLILAQFLPDFRIDGAKAVSASAQMRNPALLLNVVKEGQELYHQWVFLRADFPHMASQAAYSFSAKNVKGFSASLTYPTILEVNQNPGGGLIYLGFILCTLGLALSFYMTPQRLYVAMRQTPAGSHEVHLAGTTTRNPDLFRQRFNHWVEHLHKES
jgi:cytochrome c biogenesis protein